MREGAGHRGRCWSQGKVQVKGEGAGHGGEGAGHRGEGAGL